ncbi:hypothetical protein VCSRO122_3469 [Vibrio cholerae]|nr:hypothetical protein VCSRO122_3469 [Vibrio cholerae]
MIYVVNTSLSMRPRAFTNAEIISPNFWANIIKLATDQSVESITFSHFPVWPLIMHSIMKGIKMKK